MLSKKIKYTDFNGTKRDETFYFNLSRSELIEMETSAEGGLGNRITKMLEKQDAGDIVKTFQWLIEISYGEVSDDGRVFMKKKDGHKLAELFMQTNAYEELYKEISSSEQAAIDFFNGVIDPSVLKEIEEAQKKENLKLVDSNV